jgi:hypothetical protein
MAPDRLRKKPGDRKVPPSNPPPTTRSTDTQAATPKPYQCRAARVTTLASPGLTPGRGLGRFASKTWMAIASAASRAMRTSSSVTSNSIGH